MSRFARRAPGALFAFLFAWVLSALAPALALAEPLRLWHAYRGDEEKALEQIVKGFDGGPVEVLAIPYDAYASKLSAAIPLGEGPDVFIDGHEKLGDYLARGVVAPVGDALAAREPVAERALAAVEILGVPYGVPIGQKSVALYRNLDLAPEPPAHFEDFAAMRGRLQPGVFPLAYIASLAYFHQPLLSAFGGSFLGPDNGFAFVGPPAERSLLLVRELIERGVVPEDADGALVTSLFRSGKAAYVINGPWLAAELGPSPGVRYAVSKLPTLRETGAPMRPFLTVEAVMLSPEGVNKPAARALARLLGSREAGAIRARIARTPPARTDVPLPEGDEFLRAFFEQTKESVPTPSSRAMGAVWEPATRAIRKVLRGDAKPEVALSEAKHRFEDVRRPLPEARSPAPLLVGLGALLLLGAFLLVRRSREEPLALSLRRSLPAYKYVLHAVVAVGVLVVAPLAVGAATSLFAGRGEELRYVGLANFVSILTARGGPLLASGSFYLVLLVTILWTAVNIAFHLGIGLSLALLLHRPSLRMRALYRVLLIVPWAVPSYVTALAWKGMFHRQFGAVTGLILGLNEVFGTDLRPIAWFSQFSTAFSANVATNVWLGFPFMMVVTLGALTAVPDDVLEAAKVDGASRAERLWKVTLPIIRPQLGPAVTLGCIWTFNMFNVVFLVSGGDPDGTTDILVSEAYRWAFTREAQYGYAAAYAVIIFLMLYGATKVRSFRREVAHA